MESERGLKEMVEETLEIARDNNRMLRKMRRNAFIGGILRLVWWAVIIGVPVYVYLTIFQPYLEELGASYEGLRGQVEELKNIPGGLQDLLGG